MESRLISLVLACLFSCLPNSRNMCFQMEVMAVMRKRGEEDRGVDWAPC